MKITGHKKILFVTIFFLLFTFILANTATAQDPDSVTKLTAGIFAATEARFGQAVAISDTVMVVGAPYEDVMGVTNAGSAYVFTNDGSGWDQGEKLSAPDPERDAKFGFSVATDGHLVVIGAPGVKSAYVFTNDGTGWNQGEKLSAPDSALDFNFGQSVATGGNLVVVGTFAQSAAYVFTHDGAGWEGDPLPSPPGTPLFGFSVATDGMRIVVGAPATSSVYVFTKEKTGWDYQEISLNRAFWFGSSVSISGDSVAVGAPFDLPVSVEGPPVGQGSAYVYTYDQDSSAWDQTPQQASPALPAPGFGTSVSISGDWLAVSAPMYYVDDPILTTGAVYLFKKQVNGNEIEWVEFEEQPIPGAMKDDRFGWSVSLDGSILAAGAPFHNVNDYVHAGAAYVYTLPTANQPPTVVEAKAIPEKAKQDEQVFLEGKGDDPDGDSQNLTYQWEQDPDDALQVDLVHADQQVASFAASKLTDGCVTLTFQLTVTEYLNGEPGLSSDPAPVNVTVYPKNEIHGKLGGKHHHWVQWNKYSFYGHENEKVTINLEADDNGWHRGNKATLILKDKIWGKRLRVAEGGDLPKTITAELPADGEYAIYVLKQPWYWFWRHDNSFEEDYVLTLEGTCGRLGTSTGCKKK